MSSSPVTPDNQALVLASSARRGSTRSVSAAHLLVEFEQWSRVQAGSGNNQSLGPFEGEDGLPIRVMKELMRLLEKSLGFLPTGDTLQEFLSEIFANGWTSTTLNVLPPHPSVVPIIDRVLTSTVMEDVGEVTDRHGNVIKVYPRAYLDIVKNVRLEFAAPNGISLDNDTLTTMEWKTDGNVTRRLRQTAIDLYDQIAAIVVKHNRERVIRTARMLLKEYTEHGFRDLTDEELRFANSRDMIWTECPMLWLALTGGDQVGNLARANVIIQTGNIKGESE
ncbi:hypothetical protein JDV02_002991 [Purpureocillium takamizusanense]|uniref:Uncharacterized protein n=1 Tax=Purpureocillium takamizusanense TaxID=2060973 RepID=A0A9Q8V800_9HYPO|nr:uncharacterized protein JDV02_002991 [Purpureocillium takamizusanense]UNI16565.1 hypothetical protein JDV02_002991 [Purpureocillium takamizusanense]